MSDKIEFFLGNSALPFLTMESSFQPNDGDKINIKGVTYEVLGRSFTVDHADDIRQRSIRCNVIVKKSK
jgi:hypothetical protein